MLSLTRILVDGLLLSLGLSVIIFVSLYANPRLWLQDFPKEIRAKLPPNTPQEKRIQRLMMIPFLALIVGVMYFSVMQLKVENGGSISFFTAFANAFLVMNVFNLFDAVIIDYLILTVMKPKFAIPRGAEGMEHLLTDGRTQVNNYFKGIIFCLVFSLPVAAIAAL